MEELQGAWLMIGDLNEIVDRSEKQRGRPIEKKTFSEAFPKKC